jgi:hypothetical protein
LGCYHDATHAFHIGYGGVQNDWGGDNVKKILSVWEFNVYGRRFYYERSYQGWWFDVETYEVHWCDDLIDKYEVRDPSLLDPAVLKEEGLIPVFGTDIVALERQFIAEMNVKKRTKYFDSLGDMECDRHFCRYIELHGYERAWGRYETARLVRDCIEWCKENHIRYTEQLRR